MAEVGFIPGKVAERGEQIYRDKYQRDFEANFRGQLVLIDVKTEEAYRGATGQEAYENARRHSAKGPFHLMKVGEPGAYKLRNPSLMGKVGFIPRKVAERGEQIYRTLYQRDFEANFLGQFVMIDVETEKAYRGATAEEAYENACRQSAKGPFHLIKVGEAGAYKLRNSINGDRDWIFR